MPKAKRVFFILMLMIFAMGWAFLPALGNKGELVDESKRYSLNNSGQAGRNSDAGVNSAKSFKVIRVIDGDTIKVDFDDKPESVRFIGINTPEINQAPQDTVAYGKSAADFVKKLLKGKKVRLAFDIRKRDKYGRLLAYVYTEDGTFVNAELVRQGFALAKTVPPDVRYEALFTVLQREARKNYKGLWELEKFRLQNQP